MTANIHVIIPARYHSTRFPGKLLHKIKGVSVIERVYRQVQLAQPFSITIATDHEAIASEASAFGAEVVMTSTTHQSGTDRIAEVVSKGQFASEDIIVNVQGDEPFIAPQLIQQVALLLNNSEAPMSTLCWPINSLEQLHNPNVVKVVRTSNNDALYFSRSPIPAHRDESLSFADTYRHVGIYAYRVAFLLDYVRWPLCALEQHEALEQLRVLWSGYPIKVEEACVEPLQDINTREDLALVEAMSVPY